MLPPTAGSATEFDNSPDDLDDDDVTTPPALLDVSARQNMLFLESTANFLSGKELPAPADGLKKLEMWESILEDSNKAGLGKIKQDFAVLRAELESPQPDGHVIAQAIASLADETQKVAAASVDKKYDEPLRQLADALLKLGSLLSK